MNNHIFPPFRAKAEVAFYNFPDNQLFILKQLRFARKHLAHERRGAAVADERSARIARGFQ